MVSLYLCFMSIVTGLALGHEDIRLTEEQLKVQTSLPGDCSRGVAKEGDFVTIHFKGYFEDGVPISSTHDRGVPVEIQLGSRMLSPGLDKGLNGMCLQEKRIISMASELGLIDMPSAKPDGRRVIYEVELLGISATTTVATFDYLDLNGDKKISAEEAESLVRMFMKALSTDIGIDVKTLVSFFMTLHDKDGDGQISDIEFLDSVQVNEKVLSTFGLKEEL